MPRPTKPTHKVIGICVCDPYWEYRESILGRGCWIPDYARVRTDGYGWSEGPVEVDGFDEIVGIVIPQFKRIRLEKINE